MDIRQLFSENSIFLSFRNDIVIVVYSIRCLLTIGKPITMALRAYPKSPDFDTGFDTPSATQSKAYSTPGLTADKGRFFHESEV